MSNSIILSEMPANQEQAGSQIKKYYNYADVFVNGKLDPAVREDLVANGGGIMLMPHGAVIASDTVVSLPPGRISFIMFAPVDDVNKWRSSLAGKFSVRWKLILGHDSLTTLEFIDTE